MANPLDNFLYLDALRLVNKSGYSRWCQAQNLISVIDMQEYRLIDTTRTTWLTVYDGTFESDRLHLISNVLSLFHRN